MSVFQRHLVCFCEKAEVRKAPRATRKPWWWIGSSFCRTRFDSKRSMCGYNYWPTLQALKAEPCSVFSTDDFYFCVHSSPLRRENKWRQQMQSTHTLVSVFCRDLKELLWRHASSEQTTLAKNRLFLANGVSSTSCLSINILRDTLSENRSLVCDISPQQWLGSLSSVGSVGDCNILTSKSVATLPLLPPVRDWRDV